MQSEIRVFISGVAVLFSCAAIAAAEEPPSLGSAASFAALAGTAVHNSGPSRVTGNLGVGNDNALSGFPPGTVSLGDVFRDDAITRAAQKDLAAALGDLVNRTCTATLAGLGGTTLAPGVYCLPQAAELTGTLTLNGGENSDALWIFKTAGTLTTTAESSVVTINGAQRGNIYWRVGDSAILGSGTTFVGNLLALGNITLAAGASVSGRALSQNGAVTLNTNDVSLCCDAIRMSPSLPGGILNTPYTGTIVASGGTGSYRFERVSGSLPSGLTLSADGTVSGIPTTSGHFDFAVKVTDSRDCSRVRPYGIDICATVTVSGLPVDKLRSCVPFSHQFRAIGGSGSDRFGWTGTLPAGLSLSKKGVLSGTPTIPGSYTFSVLTFGTAHECTGTREFVLEVLCPITSITPFALPGGFVGKEYRETITAKGLCGPYTISVTEMPASDLMFFLSPTGALFAIPMKEGIFTFTVKAVSSAVPSCFATQEYTIRVIRCPKLVITPSILPGGTVGTFYEQPLIVGGGTEPIVFTIFSGALPPGLHLCDGRTICGTPTAAGTFIVGIRATNAAGCSGDVLYCTFDISPAACPSGTTISLAPAAFPRGSIGAAYSQFVTAVGGTPPYTFTVSAGTLPLDLTLTTATGEVSGIPAVAGSYDFTITATDANGCLGSSCFTIPVSVAIPALSGWSQFLLCALLAAIGLVVVRRVG